MILFRGGAISGDDNVQNMTIEVGRVSELQKKPIMGNEKARKQARI